MGKKVAGVVVILGVLIMLVFGAISFIQWYQVKVDTVAIEERAQVCSNMKDMAENLTELQENLESYGMTEGYAAVIFKSPENDMALDYKAVVALRERADLLKDSDPTSIEYNVALDDMRGTLRELKIHSLGWWNIRNVIFWIAVFGLIVTCVSLIVWDETY